MKKESSKIEIIVFIVICLTLLILKFLPGFIKSRAVSYNDGKTVDVTNVKLDDEFFKSMSPKEQIHYKILNTIDFYNSVEGSYIKVSNVEEGSETVEFAVDVKNKKCFAKINDHGKSTVTIFNNGVKLFFDNDENICFKSTPKIIPDDKIIKLLRPKERYFDNKGLILSSNKKYPIDTGYVKRDDDYFLQGANESLFNQEILPSYLKDYNRWNIEGFEKYLNRVCIKIRGSLGFKDKYSSTNFIGLFDKETGILMKFELLNKNNQVVNSLTMQNIKLNENIDSNIFNKDTKGYTLKEVK